MVTVSRDTFDIGLFARSLCAWASMIIVTIVLATLVTLLAPVSFDASRWLMRHWARTILRVVGADLEVRNQSGRDHLPRGAVYVSNHQSYLDIVALVAAAEGGFRFLAKRSLLFLPGVNIVLLGQKHFLVSLKKGLKTLQQLKRRVPKVIETGDRVLVFPEGGRSFEGAALEFQDGAAAMAIWARAHLVPVAIIGTREVLPRKNWPVRPGRIVLVVGEPIPTDELTLRDRKRLTKQAKGWILNAIRENEKEQGT